MPNRKCSFSENLQKKYPFLTKSSTSDQKAFCNVCNCEFSIANGGNSHITSHINSARHQKRFKIVENSNTAKLNTFLSIGDERQQKAKKIALAEGSFAFHNIQP